ncbi:ATP-grasp fold amidoligase family protein [Ruania alba]|uniref:Glutathione synthase/RimK-type ligase, ATP-grasp superfamily n=1 Tax=Ruania alba TaxID=648782 RepID=A0A1H5N9Y0_9MICO|nr:ATP-grasp fold amidoligase family protein [Ruania alba]SEE98479.1 Glutathione synthase/RimK-type ligase, ATP-grasp superfamily [Ruania alba]
MVTTLKASLRAMIPAIRWRDEKLRELRVDISRRHRQVMRLRRTVQDLEVRVASLEREIEQGEERQLRRDKANRRQERENDRNPSFRREILSLRTRVQSAAHEDTDFVTALRQIPRKLRNYTLAQSHGVATPLILHRWPDIDSIDFSELPDDLVLKSDGGAGGQGVFPLHRIDDESYAIAGGSTTMSVADLRARLHELDRRARPPYFAEEFITARGQEGDIPQDVKIFAFYGEVGQILLRSVTSHGQADTVRYRFLWSDGKDLGNVSLQSTAPIDKGVPIPQNLEAMVEVARHLSLCIGTAFIRVDLYDTSDGPTLGEMTRAPGGAHKYRSEHDRLMGDMWLRAQTRLERDLILGRPAGALYGDHPTSNYYVGLGGQPAFAPATWPSTVRPCSEWCRVDAEH